MNICDPGKRTETMSRIRSKDTKPEMMIRRALYKAGFRYRVNYKMLPGTPDIVLSKYRTVIFVNGCFWHSHENCKIARPPRTNKEYWLPKLEKNKMRDHENMANLASLGWKVIIVWECQIKKKMLSKIIKDIKEVLELPLSSQPSAARIRIYEPGPINAPAAEYIMPIARKKTWEAKPLPYDKR